MQVPNECIDVSQKDRESVSLNPSQDIASFFHKFEAKL